MFLSLLKSQGEGKTVVVAAVIKTLVTKSLTRRFSHLNPDQYNGACLLGLRGTVIKVMVRPISEHLQSRLNRQCRRCSDKFLSELPLARICIPSRI